MKRMLRGIVVVLLLIAILVVGWFAYYAWAIWQTSSVHVQAWLEHSTPLGTSREEVRAFAVDVTGRRPTAGYRCDELEDAQVSTSSLTTEVAEYVLLPFPMVTYAYATWCFDDNGMLVGIVVDSGSDGP